MPDESRQMRDQKMKWRFMISGRVCALFMLVAFSSVIMGTDFTIIGHKPALACCYDPPEPVIEPDPVAPSAPASDSQEEAAAPADSAAQSMVNAPQDKEESDPLPANLYAPVLRTARLAIEDGQWLKAREIVSQAREKLGPAPEFSAILAEINRHFGLSELASTSLLPENRAETPFTPVLDGRKNPLEGLIEDFGANAELLRLP
ncbi:MAG: hypothetical protein ACPGYG_08790 [Candidatus Puniceispirillaceae bacterium]|jgi:hypothetical protein